jgi:enamine deaminase RidA (YjgF/YER057c/UK114 family)
LAAPLSPFRIYQDLVFLSGHFPVVAGTDKVPLEFEQQARVALDNLERSLAAGSALDKVLSVTAFVTVREDIPDFNRIFASACESLIRLVRCLSKVCLMRTFVSKYRR